MKKLAIILISLSIIGCGRNAYVKFYKPYVDALSLTDVIVLKEGEKPEVLESSNFDRDVKTLISKGYRPIGFSGFNGRLHNRKHVYQQARRIHATVAIMQSEYTNTETTTSTLLIPQTNTTYHSGSVNSYGNYSNTYGGYGTYSGYGSYSGTSTTYSNTAVPVTKTHRRYNQQAMFFVKSTKKLKYGVNIRDLNFEQRQEYERNTGAIIYIVFEETPAFYANVIAGDFLLKVDGVEVKDRSHAEELMSSSAGESSTFTVLRNGKEKQITIKFEQ